MKKRIISLLLCVILLVTVFPVPAMAATVSGFCTPWWWCWKANTGKSSETLPDNRYDTVVSLGDSIAAGFGLKTEGSQYFSVQKNYFDSPVTSYPQLLGKELNARQVYNMGIEGFWSTDLEKTLLNPDYAAEAIVILLASELQSENPNLTAEELQAKAYLASQYHYLLTDVMKKADLITIELGGNDLLQGFLYTELLDPACELVQNPDPEDPTVVSFNGYYVRVKNHLFFAFISTLVSFMMNDSFAITKDSLQVFIDTITAGMDSIDQDDLMELLNFFSSDNMDAILKKYAAEAASSYETITQLIKTGLDITQEQYDVIAGAYRSADVRMQSASDVAPNAAKGELSEREILENGRLDIVENEGENQNEYPYHINAINPDADVVVVGSYNPFGSNYYPIRQDYEEIFSFFGQAMNLVFRTVFNGFGYYTQQPYQINEAAIEAGNKQYQSLLWQTDMNIYGQFGFCGTKTMSGYSTPWDNSWRRNNQWSGISNTAPESGSTDLLSSIAELLNCLPYTIMHYTLGNAVESSFEALNEQLKQIPGSYSNVFFADIINMLSSRTMDIHPNADGHAFIAQAILKQLEGLHNTGARIGLTDYDTLQEAVDAAENNDVILLLGDNQEQVVVRRNVSFGLDTNKYSFTGSITAEPDYKLSVYTGSSNQFETYKVSKQTDDDTQDVCTNPSSQSESKSVSERTDGDTQDVCTNPSSQSESHSVSKRTDDDTQKIHTNPSSQSESHSVSKRTDDNPQRVYANPLSRFESHSVSKLTYGYTMPTVTSMMWRWIAYTLPYSYWK